MKFNGYKFLLICLTVIMLVSCKKFLEVKPKGIIIPEKVADYEGLLNSRTMTMTFPVNLLDFTDDNLNDITSNNPSSTANGYYWRPILTVNEKADPDVWGPLYHTIYATNVIINNVMAATEGTTEKKKSVLGEALVVRATCYLDLLTVFAKAYDPLTAASDPGVPLMTSTNVTDKTPPRASVKVVLELLISDLERAAADLPTSNLNRYRATKYSAYGLLSRIYLYMADYQNALKYSDLALTAPNRVLDYNTYPTGDDMPVYDKNPEVLLQRSGYNGGSPVFMLYSDDLKSYFNDDDLRYSFLTVENNEGFGRGSLPGFYNFGITVPELLLTRAEVLARQKNFNDAMTVINELRKNRIKTAAYADQTAASGEEALTKVLMERRRELAYSGLRWFDMKRLDNEGRMPEVRRINPVTQAVEAVLSPGSPNYTFEIPVRVSMFNPDIELNHK